MTYQHAEPDFVRDNLDGVLEVASFQVRIFVGGSAGDGLSHMEQDGGLLEEPH